MGRLSPFLLTLTIYAIVTPSFPFFPLFLLSTDAFNGFCPKGQRNKARDAKPWAGQREIPPLSLFPSRFLFFESRAFRDWVVVSPVLEGSWGLYFDLFCGVFLGLYFFLLLSTFPIF